MGVGPVDPALGAGGAATAALTSVTDAPNNYAGANVEAILAELATRAIDGGTP